MNPVTLVEIDLPYCELDYAHLPCEAVLGVTGDHPCFNLIRTCQDRENFTPGTKTLRFCLPNGGNSFTKSDLPVVAIPSIQSVAVNPAVVNPGVDIGQRESVRVTFKDHPHSDAGLDKYLTERGYDPFARGTFWGKLRARTRSLEGIAFRLIRGEAGQDLDEMTTYHYVVDSITGQAETVSLVAKDVLTLADKKKAQAPRISNGVLAGDINSVAGSLTLSPAGIGDAEYPASGKVSIGGKEICQFTRSSDTVTLVTRGDSGTEAEDHDEGDIVQLVLIYDAESPSDIISDLLTNYTTGIDPSWINAADWETEVDEYIGRLYSAEIAKPTPVVDLLNELIEQVGLVFWWDPINLQLRLRSLRPVTAEARIYTDTQLVGATFKSTEQPDKRISEVWTYYGIRNPLEDLENVNNYKAAIASIDPESSDDYPQDAIHKVFSRWIIATNRPAAARLNAMLLSRYRDAPRKFTFALYSTIDDVPILGSGFQVQTWSLQDETGANEPVPAQVTSLETREDRFVVDAQESIFVTQDELETVRLIFIDDDTFNVNLRTLHDQIYSEVEEYDQVRCVIASGVTVGSSSGAPSFEVGDWPDFVDIEIIINDSAAGMKGRGGRGGNPGNNAFPGSTALYTRYPITVTNNGTIGGGGGGGGGGALVDEGFPEPDPHGGGGGGGAGVLNGAGANNASLMGSGADGTSTSGGAGGADVSAGGAGGNLGQAGSNGLGGGGIIAPGTGGAAGAAVDGESFVTYATEGTILGARIN